MMRGTWTAPIVQYCKHTRPLQMHLPGSSRTGGSVILIQRHKEGARRCAHRSGGSRGTEWGAREVLCASQALSGTVALWVRFLARPACTDFCLSKFSATHSAALSSATRSSHHHSSTVAHQRHLL